LNQPQAALQVAQAQGDNGSASFLTTYINQLKNSMAAANANLKTVLNSTATTLTTTGSFTEVHGGCSNGSLSLDSAEDHPGPETHWVRYQAAVG